MFKHRWSKDIVHNSLAKFNLRILSLDAYNQTQKNARYREIFELLSVVNKESLSNLLKNIALSKALLLQDLFVLSELNFKRGGFFCFKSYSRRTS